MSLIVKSYFLVCTAYLMGLVPALCQEKADGKKLTHRLHIGYNFGAVTPLSMPANVRSIDGWNPGFSPSLGYEMCSHISGRWGLSTGIFLDYKSMHIKDSVLYMRTSITQENNGKTASFEGDFSGKNETYVQNLYATIPVTLVYESVKWRFAGGVYLAWLLHGQFYGSATDGYIRKGGPTGDKVLIGKADFDFSDKQRRFDWGARIFASRQVKGPLHITAGMQWGCRPLFSPGFSGINFDVYNLYGTVGLGWNLN